MDYKIPECLLRPPEELTEEEKEIDDVLRRYEEEGLQEISTECVSWTPTGTKRFLEDLEYCIKHHINYYDYRPEMEDTDEAFY